ncbi:MAG: hypothetical protein J6Z43_06030 [Clostridiales bacterium]|nr:hypothetical protein [Clostridiales bacterium]
MISLKDMLYMNDDKKGSVSLETAICFSITLVFVCTVISVIVFYRADILMQRSVEQACEEISLLPPTSIVMTDTVSTLVNAFPEVEIGSEKGREVIRRVSSALIGIDGFSGNTLEDLFLEGTLAHVLANNIRSGYIERNGGSDFFVPELIDVDINENSERHILEVLVTYDTVTLAGRIQREIYSVIPVYGEPSLFLNPAKGQTDSDDIWSKDNFTRGDYFREENGANLPKTFPVIDSYEGGQCGSIVSIDLTAPTYSTASGINKKLVEEIDSLAAFDGADVVISGERYRVDGRNISSRVLTVVIPSNSSEYARADLDALAGYADLQGVTMRVVEHGTSTRYAG